MYLEVLQNRWLILVFLGGPALLLTVVLAYLAIWRERDGKGADEAAGAPRQPLIPWIRSFVPWVLVLTLVGTLAYIVIYTLAMASSPPNW